MHNYFHEATPQNSQSPQTLPTKLVFFFFRPVDIRHGTC